MSAAEDQGWVPRTAAQREMARAPRFCTKCSAWTDHFADEHDADPVATIEERQARWCSKCVAWGNHTSRSHTDEGETSR